MKLVVSYDEGDGHTYWTEHHVCLNYESAEALYIYIEEKMKEYIKKCEEDRVKYKEWEERLKKDGVKWNGRRAGDYPDEYKPPQSQIQSYWKVHPHFELYYLHFLDGNKICMPEIRTLEEWWTANCVNPE